ncbi:hypothetical protein ACRRTK_017938 [Alexandromys fortis]
MTKQNSSGILLLRKPECKVCLHGPLHSVACKRLFKNELFFSDIRMAIPTVLQEEKTVPAFDSFQFELLIPQIPPTFMLPDIPAALVQSPLRGSSRKLPPDYSNIVHLTLLMLNVFITCLQ